MNTKDLKKVRIFSFIFKAEYFMSHWEKKPFQKQLKQVSSKHDKTKQASIRFLD